MPSESFDEAYYDSNGQADDRPALRWYARMVIRYVGRGPILDFGCGTGHLLRRLAMSSSAEGFEISEYSAETARRISGRPVHTRLDDIPGGFGGLTAIHVVEHMDDETLDNTVAHWHRVLRPRGRALVVTPDLGGRAHRLTGSSWAGFSDPTHINLKRHADWRAYFLEHGFDVIREGSDGLWNVPYSRLPRLLDGLIRALPSFLQFMFGRLYLRPGSGESSLFVVERRAERSVPH